MFLRIGLAVHKSFPAGLQAVLLPGLPGKRRFCVLIRHADFNAGIERKPLAPGIAGGINVKSWVAGLTGVCRKYYNIGWIIR